MLHIKPTTNCNEQRRWFCE